MIQSVLEYKIFKIVFASFFFHFGWHQYRATYAGADGRSQPRNTVELFIKLAFRKQLLLLASLRSSTVSQWKEAHSRKK